jgi:hypothetical protein
MTNNHSRCSAAVSTDVSNSADFVAQIELVDALLDRQAEKLIALKEEHAVAFAPFECLANKDTLSEDKRKQYAAAKEAVEQVIEKINRTREREHQLRLARRLLRLAAAVTDGLQARPPGFGNRSSPASNNGPWAALPAKPELDNEGRRKLDINGKPTWSPVLEWRTRDLANRFSDAVVAAVRQAHPDDLG